MERLKQYRNDILLIGGLLLLGAGLFSVQSLMQGAGASVLVRVDGQVQEAYSLQKDGEYEILSENGRNLLVIEDGSAYIKEASCPDGLCIHMGRISRDGQSIICLPNRVSVEVTGGEKDDVDAVSY